MKNILVNKHYKKYNKVSRYSTFPVYYHTQDARFVGGITNALETEDVPFVTHVVKEGDTLDSLALYYYNNAAYFWIIADFNNILDAYCTLTIGSRLKVPTFSRIQFKV